MSLLLSSEVQAESASGKTTAARNRPRGNYALAAEYSCLRLRFWCAGGFQPESGLRQEKLELGLSTRLSGP